MDDAGVFRISSEVALVHSVDFFNPIVNDARTFGRIVAANSMSDIWAMGAKAITAMNVLSYPAGKIPVEVIEELLHGGSEKLREAGVVLVGGHTMELDEVVYGMSITGIVHPDAALTNSDARAGDRIILTKPIGTGIFGNALREDGLSREQYMTFASSMERLNLYAAEVLRRFDVSALTDVTGFGLLGHSLPMARNAGVKLVYYSSMVPLLPGILDLMKEFNPLGVCKCKDFVEDFIKVEDKVAPELYTIFSEAQTSGGLLAAVRADQADDVVAALHSVGDTSSAIIGEVEHLEKDSSDNPVYLELRP